MLILFYKTRLSRLNLIVSSSFLDISLTLSPPAANLFLSSLLSFDSSSLIKSLNNFINDVDKFIEFFFSEEFVNKNKKKKEDKEKEEKEENKIKRDVEKKDNNNKKFLYE